MCASFQPALSANFRRVESPEALRNLGNENLGELNQPDQRLSDSAIREAALLRRGVSAEPEPAASPVHTPAVPGRLSGPPAVEVAPQAGSAVLAAPQSAQSLREQMNLPTAEQFPRLSVDELRERYATNRALIEPEVEKRRDQFISVGFSGRGADDLERIFVNRQGADGRALQVFGMARLKNESTRSLFDNLEEAAVHSVDYATTKCGERQRLDPESGGILVLTFDSRPMSESPSGRHKVRPYEREEYLVERTTFPLTPSTFDTMVLGAIGYNRFGPMHEVSESMGLEYGKVVAERERALFNDPGIPGMLEREINYHERIFLARQFLALALIVDTIALMES